MQFFSSLADFTPDAVTGALAAGFAMLRGERTARYATAIAKAALCTKSGGLTMKAAACLNKSVDALLSENNALCRQLASLQARASELIQKRSAEVEQLNTVVEFLNVELHHRDAMILFLQTKLQEFRKMTELPAGGRADNQLVCK